MKDKEIKKNVVAKPLEEVFIPDADNDQDAAFRIVDKVTDGDKEFLVELHYSSTRIGGLKRVKGGYTAMIDADYFAGYAGKKYTLVKLGNKRKVISGEIKALPGDKKSNDSS